MTRTLQVIEQNVNTAMDHLTQALEPLDWRDAAWHIRRAACCFLACAWALSAELHRVLEKSEEKRPWR